MALSVVKGVSNYTVYQGDPEGECEWTDVSNITAEDGATATANCDISPYYKTKWLVCYNFDFNIPSNATIEGIKVRLKAKSQTLNSVMGYVQLGSWDGESFTEKGDLKYSYWSDTLTDYNHGGNTDLWNATWLASEFDNQFGFYIYGKASSLTHGYLDYAEITIYYTVPHHFF